ncbi:MAG TPA: nucleoside hydrolase, partial [Verrucomicrobiota bacterium]|nr:nucleoside hydrolase [Verrucomicrobiota bacterium]
FHPHDDPDDHFDLAVLYAVPGINIEGIVLDQGAMQRHRPGRIPVSQLNRLTGRRVPVAIGLPNKLRSPDDKALDQDADGQEGVRLILDTLEASPQPVALVTVGSARDIVAAFNRHPALCRRKVGRVLCFIGEASKADFREHNVGLDPQAFIALMRSGLPIDWVPCFDGGPWKNRGRASFWQASHADLLGQAPVALVQYCLYALEKGASDPLAFLEQSPDPARRAKLFDMKRNLWCAAVFVTLAGRGVAFEPDAGVRFLDVPSRPAQPLPSGLLFAFEDVDLSISDNAEVRYGSGPDSKTVRRFKVLDGARYGQGMTAATAALLRDFPRQ